MKGRPIGSQIRQNLIELLFLMKEGYGYDIYKNYVEVFPKVTMRSIYYHLKKGVELEEFKIVKAVKEEGDYSWGRMAEKVYYKLGERSKPRLNEKVKGFLDKKEAENKVKNKK